jgi:hypothetical protein
MTDKELLELAAKTTEVKTLIGTPNYFDETEDLEMWNPLIVNGDAFKLLVDLKLAITFTPNMVEVTSHDLEVCVFGMVNKHQDIYSSTRRAIVATAAEIGKGI